MHKEYEKSGEFSLIKNIERLFCDIVPQGVVGIGDDCAVLGVSGGIATVVSKDLLLEGVHFTREMSPREIGVRAVQVNISDVAAMGARPSALLLGIGLPKNIDREWSLEFVEGVRSCGVPLLGGDTTRSESGVVISVTAFGNAPSGNLKFRSGAKCGDTIMVTGKLGGSVLSGYKMAVEARVEQGVWLGGRGEVHAMMDISDGVAGDLVHILEKSGVGAVVNLESVPLFEGVTLEQGLSGGEDYELLLTVATQDACQLKYEYQKQFSEELFEIGVIRTEAGIEYCDRGRIKKMNINGFRHF